MSTIGDVAERAGVSKMTVSRVINKSGYISQETRERVEQAIAELGYVPNALARSLRFKKTKTIALVITDITNPFFTTLARGVEDAASEQDFSVMFCNTDESRDEEAQYLSVLVQKQVDGVLLVPAKSSPEAAQFLSERQVPFVVLDRRIPGINVDLVRGNSFQGAYDLAAHLIALGHRDIAVLSGPQGVTTASDRIDGYRKAMQDAGLPVDESRILYTSFTPQGGYRMAQQALELSPRPTALFAANNFIAFGALRALRERSVRVPDEISVVTFDDLPEAINFDPFLTAAAQPAYEMGQRATTLLFERLSGNGPAEPQEIIMPTQIVIRGSSGRVPSPPAPLPEGEG
jgi:LacI family transcriptional regulator